jgi:hypothetical protein
MKITNQQIREIAKNSDVEYAALKAFLDVESGGEGFDPKTGKLIIQFEPKWFIKNFEDWDKDTKHTVWQSNGVGSQSVEWPAFNSAWAVNPEATMESTSIGLPQIMGFHFKRLGYKTVDDMYDDFKRGEYQQVLALVRFIKSDPKLYKALRTKDWHTVAYIYNGAAYAKMAKVWGREPYNISMAKAYNKYSLK